MPAKRLDLTTWPRGGLYTLFRTYAQPHYALTTRIDVTALMAAKAKSGLSPFRTTIWAIGAGIAAVEDMRIRFQGADVLLYDAVTLSTVIPVEDGSFRFIYSDWQPDRAAFDATVSAEIDAVRAGQPVNANSSTDRADMAYLSCLPWIDYTALDNALPGPDDCIPRISWGRIVPKADGYDMAMTCQAHHALMDGQHLARFFHAVEDALTSVA